MIQPMQPMPLQIMQSMQGNMTPMPIPQNASTLGLPQGVDFGFQNFPGMMYSEPKLIKSTPLMNAPGQSAAV